MPRCFSLIYDDNLTEIELNIPIDYYSDEKDWTSCVVCNYCDFDCGRDYFDFFAEKMTIERFEKPKILFSCLSAKTMYESDKLNN